MIEKFITRFDANRDVIRKKLSEKHPESYEDIVRIVVESLDDEKYYDSPDPKRIHQIDDGDYQGTLCFVIGAKGYQPNTYWAVLVGYGSCSGCDTLESIRNYSDESVNDKQVSEYMTLAVHILQGLRELSYTV